MKADLPAQACLRIAAAAGATSVTTTQPCFYGFEPLPAGPGREAVVQDLVRQVRAARFPPFTSPVLSALSCSRDR